MRGMVIVAAAVVMVGGFCAPAHGQIGLFLASGTGPDQATTAAYWVAAPANARAVAVADIVTLSLNPLNSSLVMLAADGQVSRLSPGPQNPPIPLSAAPGGASLFGGSPPGAKFGGAPGAGSGGGGGGGSGSGGGSGTSRLPDGTPLVTLTVTPPTAEAPGSVSVLASNADGFQYGTGITIPYTDGGWWTLETSLESDPLTGEPGNTGGGQSETPPPPAPVPGPVGETPGSGIADTPEPATAVLAVIGAAGVGVARRWRK